MASIYDMYVYIYIYILDEFICGLPASLVFAQALRAASVPKSLESQIEKLEDLVDSQLKLYRLRSL